MTVALDRFTHAPRIAYFSMEFALRNDVPTYAGGLGVLAGDLMRSAADLDVAMVGVTLASRKGYFRQQLSADGEQTEWADDWEPAHFASPVGTAITVRLAGRDVWVNGWLYIQTGIDGGVPILLLDTRDERNAPEDRALTDLLYGGDTAYRLKQDAILGIGGVRLLRALGFHIREYHLNEGHSALLGIELLRELLARGVTLDAALDQVRGRTNFTTHTPIEAAHDHFPYALVQSILGETIDLALLRNIGGDHELNMNRLARGTAGVVNGVAADDAHGESGLKEVANGVHSAFWTSSFIAALYDRYIPQWRHEPALLTRAARIPDAELQAAHAAAKAALLDAARVRTGVTLDSNLPIVAFARRMTGYKRPDLIFHDLDRLRRIAADHPFQIVLAGKAHPHDDEGKRLIRVLHTCARDLGAQVPVLFLPQYDLELAQLLVAGSDLWLNTPLPPLEASGTSGMKAAHNGVPSLSVLDGWWVEGWLEGITGWAVDDDGCGHHASCLYDKLQNVVLPLYYARDGRWTAVMKGAIVHNASLFNSHRTLRRYAAEVYLAAT